MDRHSNYRRFVSGNLMYIAAVITCLYLPSCSEMSPENLSETDRETAVIRFCSAEPKTKAMDPDETEISDINVFVFNSYGILEGAAYLNVQSGQNAPQGFSWNIDLVKNGTYSIYACANFGYEVDVASMDGLENLRYYMAYPDDYSIGMPMSGYLENVRITGDEITVPLERLMAKISLKVDRRRLDENVEFKIRSIQVEGCPRSVYPFSRNHIRDPFDFFPSGFLRKDYETDALNLTNIDGLSGEVCLYMLENMQGDLLPGNDDESLKVLPDSEPAKNFCSYIEIKAEYLSPSYQSKPGEYLIYRFYPGENPSNFDVCRNVEYRICIVPSGSGLEGTEWRIDKSGIEVAGQSLELSYTDLSLTYIGETVRIQAFMSPGNITQEMLRWESDDTSVATVSDKGEVTARGEGSCTVRCHSGTGNECSAECLINVEFHPYYMKIFPGNFIRCRQGDIISFQVDYFPDDAAFDIGIEELEYDKNRGIYDYEISEDGKSVTLYTKSRGSGLLYMEAGYPINDAEMIVLVID